MNRSSYVSTGTSTAPAERRRERCVSCACSPRSPRSVSGRPTTTRSASSSRDQRDELAQAGVARRRARRRRAAARAFRSGRRRRRRCARRRSRERGPSRRRVPRGSSSRPARARPAGFSGALPPARAIVGRPPPPPPIGAAASRITSPASTPRPRAILSKLRTSAPCRRSRAPSDTAAGAFCCLSRSERSSSSPASSPSTTRR